MSTYRVIGQHAYLGHQPGSVFSATIQPAAEQRALARGNIEVLDATPPGLIPGSYRPPDGWDSNKPHLSEAPSGASLIEGA